MDLQRASGISSQQQLEHRVTAKAAEAGFLQDFFWMLLQCGCSGQFGGGGVALDGTLD